LPQRAWPYNIHPPPTRVSTRHRPTHTLSPPKHTHTPAATQPRRQYSCTGPSPSSRTQRSTPTPEGPRAPAHTIVQTPPLHALPAPRPARDASPSPSEHAQAPRSAPLAALRLVAPTSNAVRTPATSLRRLVRGSAVQRGSKGVQEGCGTRPCTVTAPTPSLLMLSERLLHGTAKAPTPPLVPESCGPTDSESGRGPPPRAPQGGGTLGQQGRRSWYAPLETRAPGPLPILCALASLRRALGVGGRGDGVVG
jgi:hypothetical protein